MRVLEWGDEKEGAEKYVKELWGWEKNITKSPLTKSWFEGRATTFSALLYFSCREYGSFHKYLFLSWWCTTITAQLQLHRGSQHILKHVPWSTWILSISTIMVETKMGQITTSSKLCIKLDSSYSLQGVRIQVMSVNCRWREHVCNNLCSEGNSSSSYWLKYLSWREILLFLLSFFFLYCAETEYTRIH